MRKQTLIMGNNPETWELRGSDPNKWRLLHDIELPAALRKERPSDEQGWPETVKLIVVGGNGVTPLTEELQWWIFRRNVGLPPESFEALLDTWNPGEGMKIRDKRNYITGERLDADFPKLPLDLTFAGNIVHVVNEPIWEGGNGVPAGTPMLQLETLNTAALPEKIEYVGNEHLIHHLLTAKGTYVNPFIYNGGGRNGGKPCFTGLMAEPNTTVYIERARAKKLDSLRIPSPYIPEFNWK